MITALVPLAWILEKDNGLCKEIIIIHQIYVSHFKTLLFPITSNLVHSLYNMGVGNFTHPEDPSGLSFSYKGKIAD